MLNAIVPDPFLARLWHVVYRKKGAGYARLVHHHILNIVPTKAKPLREYMKNCGTNIGEFSRTYQFVKATSDNPETKKSVCRAIIIL